LKGSCSLYLQDQTVPAETCRITLPATPSHIREDTNPPATLV